MVLNGGEGRLPLEALEAALVFERMDSVERRGGSAKLSLAGGLSC